MAKQELYDKSPIRIFDNATEGGLKAGEIGLVTAKKGLGKTSVLVQFGMDTLLDGNQLVHVSFDQHSSNVISWYDGIFTEIARKKNLLNADEVKENVFRNRTILNFNQENFNLTRVVNTLNALNAGGIKIAGVVIDGVDLKKVEADELQAVQAYAKASKASIWMSANAEGESIKENIPSPLEPFFTAVINLTSKDNNVKINILKFRDKKDIETGMKLDTKSFLILEK